MKLIVGLGNPGENYKMTRHNAGFIYVDEYLKENGFRSRDYKNKFKGEIAELNKLGKKALFLKPLTFMNLSGESVREAVNFYKLDPAHDLFVIYDDMDLELGRIKIRKNGRPGGHNGIKSIISHVGPEFIRIKCGIGRPGGRTDVVNYVLGKLTDEEKEVLKENRERINSLIDDIINGKDADQLMAVYNQK